MLELLDVVRKWIYCVVGFLLLAATVRGQEPLNADLEELLEPIEEGDEVVGEELWELLDYYREHPINLNDTNSRELLNLPFINEIQWESLRSYIALYGNLLSWKELRMINGFDSATCVLLRPMVCAVAVEHKYPITWNSLLHHGSSNLMMGVNGTIERARGYQEQIYEGSPFRMYGRYRYRYYDRIELQLSFDKDPGEALFSGSQKYGFDFYGYHLAINDVGIIQKLVVGQYQLQFGQGATLWTGFSPWGSMNTNVCRYAQGIRPASAFTEYGYLQGVAASVSVAPHLTFTPFYSYVNRDATGTQSYYLSGYHRTATEIDKKNQFKEQLFGCNLQYRATHWHIGATAYGMLLDKALVPENYVYNQHAFRGDKNFNIGLDGAYHTGRMLFFGEVALSPGGHFAGIAGTEYVVDGDNRVSIYYRNYSPEYQNMYAHAIGQQRNVQNERGFCLNAMVRLPWEVRAMLCADFFQYPWLKYGTYSPSRGSEYRIQLSRSFGNNVAVEVRYRQKRSYRNTTLDDAVQYVVEQINRQQIQTDIRYEVGGWRMVTRIAYAWVGCEFHDAESGFLLYQDVGYQLPHFPLTLTARFALFDVSDYDARLYTVESDMAYNFGSQSFVDQGLRSYVVARYNINEDLCVGFKYAVTAYSNRETVGTGYEQIDGNRRQQWHFQLRWKF